MMPTTEWNYADVWEQIAERFADEPALLHGSTSRTWGEFDRRAEAIARALLDAGLGHQDKVAQYCRNRPEYLEAKFAAFKVSLVPVNTNFRYGPDELAYLWTDSDTAAVVFDAEFTETCEALRRVLPAVKAWLWVGTPSSECPKWAIEYEDAAKRSAEARRTRAPWPRSGGDLDLLYTGGTTGTPKGVMWRQHDLFAVIETLYGRNPPDDVDVDTYLSRIERPGPRVLPGPPLMHGTACWFAMSALSTAGSVVTLTRPRFDPAELLDAVVDRRVKGLCIVGDAFAKPIIAEMHANPGRWDLGHVRLIVSSGVMLSRESKEQLLELAPGARIADGLGTSESGSVGTSVTTAPGDGATARFRLGDNVRVLGDDGRDVVPGSGQAGRLAVSGHLPVGYYGDADKTASTFVTIDGRRYVIAGDWAILDEDRTITLLGRGSGCINTAGEKVYPEEVEEVLKLASGVRDASVLGIPDDRFGESVVALVEMEAGGRFDEEALIQHAKEHLANFKAPKAVIQVEAVARHANGKMDYSAMREKAISALQSP
jgi:acyl-CoA synthetase (AMP-forming)/AMP-acid ligase II